MAPSHRARFDSDIWDDTGDSIVEHVAGVDDFEVAEATYRAAVARAVRPSFLALTQRDPRPFIARPGAGAAFHPAKIAIPNSGDPSVLCILSAQLILSRLQRDRNCRLCGI